MKKKIDAFKGTISLPFEAGSSVAVKIIDDRGIEESKSYNGIDYGKKYR